MGRNLSATATSGYLDASFLMKVISSPSTSGAYFFHFFKDTSGTTWGSALSIKASGAGFQLGIGVRSSSTPQWVSTVFNLNQTYLVVVRYTFVTGNGNDVASLWINPSLSGGEPSPDAVQTNTGGPDLTNIGRVALRENSGMGAIEIDEMRVGRTWNDSPLPVQMESMSARVEGGTVRLSFRTATEVDAAGFNISRALAKDGPFELIASYASNVSLRASGTAASGGSYTFVDSKVSSGKTYYYRIDAISKSGKAEQVGGIIEVVVSAPQEFALFQNYPNPFNPTTAISYQLSVNSQVTLKVYDVLGRGVETLVDERQDAGSHSVNFDASKLPSGVYFYSVTAGSYSAIRKMAVMK